MLNNQVNSEFGNVQDAAKSDTPIDEVKRRQHVIAERMKTLTEEQIIHALYVEASILVQQERNGENESFKAGKESLKINEK